MPEPRLPDWEAFYRDYRKPGYVSGFEITSKLGGGMFGLVFRARRQSIGKDYAIKFLQVEDPEVRRAVLAELEQVKHFAQIDHPNLVSIEDRGEVDGIPYLVMQFAGTQTLRDLMPADGALPTAAQREDLLRYFLQACRGVAALHERSLVHFDVKPANVFVKGPVARIGDYGLSKMVTHSRGSLSMGRGTPYYMAPELLQRRGDHRSDVYSLGVVLYELLCGVVPFRGDSEWEVLRKHETEPPALPTHLSARERAILQRCLQKDPAARFQSVHDLIAAFGDAGLAGGMGEPASAPVAAASADGVAASCLEAVAAPAATPAAGPRVAAPKAPAPTAPKKRRSNGMWLTAVVCIAIVAWVNEDRPRRQRTAGPSARMEARAPMPAVRQPPAPRDAGPDTAAKSTTRAIEQLVASVQGSLRSAARRSPPKPKPLDRGKVALPADLDWQVQRIRQATDAVSFSTGHADKLARDGHTSFLAGVQLLQTLDYRDVEACRRAALVHRLLAHWTAIDGMRCEATGCEPEQAEQRRFQIVADGWRRLCESLAKDHDAYQALLAVKGKVAGKGSDR